MVWLVIIASLYTIFASSGILFSFFVFSKPIQAEFAWSATTLVITLLISLVLAGLIFLAARRSANRFSIRLVVSASALLLGVGCIFMSQIVSVWQLFVFWGIVVGIGIGGGIVSAVCTLQTWFSNRRLLIFVTFGAGIVFGILTVPAINSQLILTYGWRTAYILIGEAALFSLFPTTILLIAAQSLKYNFVTSGRPTMYSNLWPRGEWFIRHLNWTVVLFWLLAIPLPWAVIIGLSLLGENDNFVFGIWLVIGTIWIIGFWYLLVWNLRHKGRSLFNLFYLLIPFGIGWIVFLCISNREQLAKEKAEREEREKFTEDYWKEHGKIEDS